MYRGSKRYRRDDDAGELDFSELSGECRRRIDNRLSNSNLNVSQYQEQLTFSTSNVDFQLSCLLYSLKFPRKEYAMKKYSLNVGK